MPFGTTKRAGMVLAREKYATKVHKCSWNIWLLPLFQRVRSPCARQRLCRYPSDCRIQVHTCRMRSQPQTQMPNLHCNLAVSAHAAPSCVGPPQLCTTFSVVEIGAFVEAFHGLFWVLGHTDPKEQATPALEQRPCIRREPFVAIHFVSFFAGCA